MSYKIIILSDSPFVSSGYGTAARNIAKAFVERGNDVSFISFQHTGGPAYFKIHDDYFPVYEGITAQSIARAFNEINGDVAIHIRDAFYGSQKYFQAAYNLSTIPKRPKVFLWTPVQGDNLPQEFVDICIRDCDYCVAFTDWGKEVLLFQGVPFNRLYSIHLGVDVETYKKRSVDKEEYGFSRDSVVIGSVGINNQYRKGYPILLKAFSTVKKKMPKAELYLHTQPVGTFELTHYAQKLGLKGSVLYPAQYSTTWGISDDDMASIYNCFSAYCTTSMAEGFNLPLLEAVACGIPCVCSDTPVHREVAGPHALYAKTSKLYPSAWTFDYIADPDDVAAKLIDALSLSEEERAKKSELAMSYAEMFSWKNIAGSWLELFKQVGL